MAQLHFHDIIDFIKGQPLFDAESLATTRVANQSFQDLVRQSFPLVIEANITIKKNVWISPEDAQTLTQNKVKLVDFEGRELATSGDGSEGSVISSTSLIIRYAWDLLNLNECVIGAFSHENVQGEISPQAVIEGIVKVGKGTRILPGVYIEGNAIIGENCKIGPNCYIRGNTAIGDNCHIGNAVEVKNSIIGNHTNAGHLSYIGDTIIGDHTNLGAGTITSNYRADKQNHTSYIDGKKINTGRRKFGSIIGHHVFTGINTSIYPGRKLSNNTMTLPGTMVTKDL